MDRIPFSSHLPAIGERIRISYLLNAFPFDSIGQWICSFLVPFIISKRIWEGGEEDVCFVWHSELEVNYTILNDHVCISICCFCNNILYVVFLIFESWLWTGLGCGPFIYTLTLIMMMPLSALLGCKEISSWHVAVSLKTLVYLSGAKPLAFLGAGSSAHCSAVLAQRLPCPSIPLPHVLCVQLPGLLNMFRLLVCKIPLLRTHLY